MNFPFYIARRYLFSKKSTHAINIISGISGVGVAVATMALVVTLSVFNGFHDLVATFFTSFDPQLEVVPVVGKTAPADDPALAKIKTLPEVEVTSECVKDQALAIYKGRQTMITLMGVDDNFERMSRIDEILYGNENFSLHAANLNFGTVGIRLAETLGMNANWDGSLMIYAPRKIGQLDMANPTDGFVVDSLISPGSVFMVKQGKYDKDHVIAPISFARTLFEQQGMLSSLQIRLKNGSDLDKVKAEMQSIAGNRFKVLDRYEQQQDTFRIMQVEKFIAYIFLTFILIVASFNIIGSISMLIIDKKDDVVTLRNLGATDRQITKIFLFEGRLISVFGAVVGILVGLFLCWLQQQFGLVALGQSSGTFVVDAYPVSVHPEDVAVIFFTVILVGFIAVWYPVRYFSKRLLR